MEHLRIIECIRFSNFKEKIAITKERYGKGKLEICDGYVYFERIVCSK